MPRQVIAVGTSPNDGQGDQARTAFVKTNDMFTEVYSGRGAIRYVKTAAEGGDDAEGI